MLINKHVTINKVLTEEGFLLASVTAAAAAVCKHLASNLCGEIKIFISSFDEDCNPITNISSRGMQSCA